MRARRIARLCTFREAVESGTQQIDDVDDWVEAWHRGDAAGLQLHERLGLSWDDYSRWVSEPDSLAELLGVTAGPTRSKTERVGG